MSLPFFSPLRLIPQPVTAISLSIVLNLFFKRYPELKQRLGELSGKIFQFEIEDFNESLYMNIDDGGDLRIHVYSDDVPHVIMTGTSGAFLSLLFHTTDPDSLFFSRSLQLSGETDTGLHFKNILDNIDIDWERELGSIVGRPTARVLLSLAQKAKDASIQSKENLEGELENWLKEHNVPSKSRFTTFQEEVNALKKQSERLEKSLLRVTRKQALAQSPKNGTQKAPHNSDSAATSAASA